MSESRRKFIKKAAYIAPALITLTAVPSLASAGSVNHRNRRKGNEGLGNRYDAPPPGHSTNCNDYFGTSPGNPGKCGKK
jgi:hypothetical protein